MAEKWDESANDSPEVVYEGFSPPSAPHTQGMISASSSFVSVPDNNEGGHMGGSTTNYMAAAQAPAAVPVPPVIENQGEGSHHEAVEDRARLCFVCCSPVSDKNFESIKTSMNHSHAPLLVLLTDVLGYKLEDGRLHSQVVCKACYHLLDIIDELQQTLTESKTDVRTKFLETVQKMKLKYPRTDKMLKPRCLRCIQMSQSSARKRGRGRGWKGRCDDGMRGKGRGRGRGRGRSQSNDGSDNDGEGLGICEEEISKDVLPPKSLHQTSSLGALKTFDRGGMMAAATCTDCSCGDVDPTCYECVMCKKSDSEVFYQYCKSCLTCQGTFVPWGINVTLRFVGDQCSITQINARSYYNEEVLYILTRGLQVKPSMYRKDIEFNDNDDDDEKVSPVKSAKKSPSKMLKEKVTVNREKLENNKIKDVSKETQKVKPDIHIKKELKGEDSDGAEDGTGEVTPDGSDEEEEEDNSDSPILKASEVKKEDMSDIDKLFRPIFKIHEGRLKEKPPQKKKKQKQKTLSDEFENILSMPSLGKRKIKPTEKVKWLAERCLGRRKDASPKREEKIITKRSRHKVIEEEDLEEDEERNTKNKSSPKEDKALSPAKRKKKLTEKALQLVDKPSSDVEKENTEVKGEIQKDSNEGELGDDVNTVVKEFEEEEVHDSDADPDYVAEGGAGEESETELHDKGMPLTVVKTELLGSEILDSEIEDTIEKSVKVFEELSQGTDNKKDPIYVKTDVTVASRKRGRPPGKKRRRRIRHIDMEEELVIKTADGKEIDLSRISVKNLQESDNKYRCPVCNREYRSQGGIQYHLATHTSSARYACSLCPYRTIRHGDLKKHFVIHTGLKPYKCDVCQQEFSTSSSFKRHLRIHSGEKPYRCDVCGKDFRNITTRKQHMILHTGEKNFVCEVCGKSFALKHHYTSHRKRHNGEMPFKCIHCDSSFKTHNAVKMHRKKEHPVEEAERIQQNRLRRKSAIKEVKIKVEEESSSDPQVFQAPDVLEQAMAATVETVDGVHYEYVDVADPSIPLVSKMIKENWNGRDSVVLTITHIEEDEYNDDEEDMLAV